MTTVSAGRRTTSGYGWPEGLAATLVLAVLALVASGLVDPMLPWTR
ncbi:hypothetical protein Lfu02_34580 [Longispora fulva]|uniref:Uncharacterized protein n=1 Tax=Longispora fulva TaxID=619741 RepID=A0A8J7GQZ7_9ACTN|nr:hypothetical protein [Longispora fulva]MBG6141758.1 hypothetical protein [Longispora fulva]GIG59086.1 hypothetical protein Lfu02_34580 [Longispora fulva]